MKYYKKLNAKKKYLELLVLLQSNPLILISVKSYFLNNFLYKLYISIKVYINRIGLDFIFF